jgi:hypothetical protein
MFPIGWARVNVVGGVITSVRGYNVQSVTRFGVGAYQVLFNTAAPDNLNSFAVGQTFPFIDLTLGLFPLTGTSGHLLINVNVRTVGSTPVFTDSSFGLIAWG